MQGKSVADINDLTEIIALDSLGIGRFKIVK